VDGDEDEDGVGFDGKINNFMPCGKEIMLTSF